MPDKIMRTDIEMVDGEPCVVFSGSGKNLCFPAKGLQDVFDDAMRRYIAFAAQHGLNAGQWRQAMILMPQTWNVATTDDGKVAVTVDRGQPTEQTFALSSGHARELGQQLAEEADKAPPPPRTH